MILRHFDTTYTEERIRSLPRFDGFVFTDGHNHEAIAQELAAEGKHWWAYFNVLTLPPAEWPSPLPPYLQFLRDQAPPLRHPGTGEPVPSWSGGRHILDYAEASPVFLLDMAEKINQTILASGVPGAKRAFLDLAYQRVMPWMILDYYHLFPADKWVQFEANFQLFLTFLRLMDVEPMCNGDRELAGRLYFELAQLTWTRDLAAWRNDSDVALPHKTAHVLSVEARDIEAVMRLVANHQHDPTRWIAFTTMTPDEAAIDLAYELAAL